MWFIQKDRVASVRPSGLFVVSMRPIKKTRDHNRPSPYFGHTVWYLFLDIIIMCLELLLVFIEIIIINVRQFIIKSEKVIILLIFLKMCNIFSKCPSFGVTW